MATQMETIYLCLMSCKSFENQPKVSDLRQEDALYVKITECNYISECLREHQEQGYLGI